MTTLSVSAITERLGALRFSLILLTVVLSCRSVRGQTIIGIPDFGTSDGQGLIRTNLADLTKHSDILLRASSARNLSTPIDLALDESFSIQGGTSYSNGVVWQLGTTIVTQLDSKKSGNNCSGQQDATYTISGAWDGYNAYHSLGILPIVISQNGCPNNPSGSGVSKDGWHFSASVSSTGQLSYAITDLYGNVHSSSTTVKDPNGNLAQLSGALSFIDASGNTFLTRTGGLPPTATYSYNGPIGSNGQPATEQFTPTYALQTVATNFGCPGEVLASSSSNLLTKLTLPDGSFYKFSYEPTVGVSGAFTGRLASITLPAGGTISYSYAGFGTNGINCADGSTAGFTKTTPDGIWTYTHSINFSIGAGTTTVTAPSGDYVTLNFSNQYELERQAFTSNGTLLGKTITCYNQIFTNCTTASVVSGSIFQKDVYFYPGNSTSPSLVETKYVPGIYSSRLPTQISRYDFGATFPPGNNYLSQTTIVYGNGTSCAAGPTVASVCSSITTDSGGNPKQARYNTYDSFGNLLTEKDWVSGPLTGGTYLTKQFTYYSTGLVHVATDFNGATTTYTYGSCSSSFPSSLVYQPSGLTASETWDCSGEVPVTSTDANLQPTGYGYVNANTSVPEPFWRASSVTDPLLNTTNMFYAPKSLESVLTFNSSASTVDQLETYDSLGRPHVAQTRQSPSAANYDSVETDYDVDGRVSRVSVPYSGLVGALCTTCATTQTTFDNTGRMTITDGGGGTTSYSHLQKDVVRAVGPTQTFQKQLEYDGLGRLASVCEVTSVAGSGSCQQFNPATGLLTKYTYDALGNLMTVNQNVQPNAIGGPQSRSYAYDGLSRLTSESNPESGVTGYTYDSDPTCGTSAGDLVKRVDNATNVTCYAYDSLHRVIKTSYPSGPYSAGTPTKTFVYDSTGFSCPNGSNVKGRLAEAYTGSSTSKTTDLGYCYSPRGEVTDIYSSSLTSGGFYHVTKTYWPHGAVASLGGLPAVPTLYYGGTDGSGLDGEGRVTKVTASSGQGPVTCTTSPCVSYNPAGQVTNVVFGSGDSDSYQYDPNTGRMKQYSFNVNSQSVIGKLTWNPNGTLGQLQITQDPFNPGNVQTCTNGYDDLSRITSVNCVNGSTNVWAQTFSDDAFGNITKSGSSSWMPNYASPSNNQYQTGWNGVSYDSNGNLTNDTFHTYQWDSDGHPVVIGNSSQTYDALGNLVVVSQPGWRGQILHDENGYTLGDDSGDVNGNFFALIPLPGGGTANYGGGSLQNYGHVDWLGTSRLTSSTARAPLGDQARAPYGEPYAVATMGGGQGFFAKMGQDISGDMYDTPNREYQTTQGRWLRPDPAGLGAVDPTNPQSWNRYAYVLNNPLSAIDPLGLNCVWDDGSYDSNDDPEYGDTQGGRRNCGKDGGTWLDNVNGPDWSGDPNSLLAQAVQDNNSGNFQSVTVMGTPTTADMLNCAAQFGSNHSIAAAFGAQNNFVANLFGGNSVSGLVNLGLLVSGHKTPTWAQLAAIPLKGVAQGIPIPPELGHPGLGGAVGQLRSLGVQSATAGAYNAIAGVGQETIELGITASGSVATPVAQLSAQALSNIAFGVTAVKFAFDASTFLYGYFGACR